jgi:hypothetical protein
MAESEPDIVIAAERLEPSEVARLVQLFFGEMVIGRGEPLT